MSAKSPTLRRRRSSPPGGRPAWYRRIEDPKSRGGRTRPRPASRRRYHGRYRPWAQPRPRTITPDIFRRVRDRRPHLILKLAVSSDDRIGAAGRKPVAISGEAGPSPGASAPRAMRRRAGRDRHRPRGRSAVDLPPAGHGGAIAGSSGAGSRAAPAATARLVHSARENAALGHDVGAPRGARRHATRRGRCAGDWRSNGRLAAAGARCAGCVAGAGRGAASRGYWWKAARRWHRPWSRLALSTKSGCCAGRRRSEPTASPRWTHCRSPPSRSRPPSAFVLATGWIGIH